VVTAGWKARGLASLYPYGIPVGRVTRATVAEQEASQQVHVRPFADLRELEFVQVLTKGGGG
jgi:rod shape-determining protein MreC